VPIFHRAKVLYGLRIFLEQRFEREDADAGDDHFFLIGRGLGAGLALAAPVDRDVCRAGMAVLLDDAGDGGLIILYTTLGGIKAVTYADVAADDDDQ